MNSGQKLQKLREVNALLRQISECVEDSLNSMEHSDETAFETIEYWVEFIKNHDE